MEAVAGLSKKDIGFAAIIGFVVAVILLLIGVNIDVSIPLGIGIVIVFPILSIIGLWLANIIARRIFVVWQIAKFGLVGALNTFVDLGVLNLLILITGVATGNLFSLFKGISFLVAVGNSYYWNKFWTFKSQKGGFFPFFIVSAVGLLINVGIASFVDRVIGAPPGISNEIWANVAGISALAVSLIWNFVGYKFLVFKK